MFTNNGNGCIIVLSENKDRVAGRESKEREHRYLVWTELYTR